MASALRFLLHGPHSHGHANQERQSAPDNLGIRYDRSRRMFFGSGSQGREGVLVFDVQPGSAGRAQVSGKVTSLPPSMVWR